MAKHQVLYIATVEDFRVFVCNTVNVLFLDLDFLFLCFCYFSLNLLLFFVLNETFHGWGVGGREGGRA